MMCFLAINIKQKEGVEKKFQTALADLSGDLWREINFLLIYKSDNEVVRYGIIPNFIASSEHVLLIIIVRIIICEKRETKSKP